MPSALLRLPASDNGLRVSGDGAAARRDVQHVRGGEKRRETARNAPSGLWSTLKASTSNLAVGETVSFDGTHPPLYLYLVFQWG